MTTPDLTAAVAEYYRDGAEAWRGDELALHVADLPGCSRAAWSRIQGLEQAVAPFATRVTWDVGHRYEAVIADALRWWCKKNGWQFSHGGVVLPDGSIANCFKTR